MNAVPLHIRRSNLFGSLADEQVQEILNACRQVSLRSGDHACRQGEIGESMFVIVRGRVSINVEEPDGRTRVLNYLTPGDHFGEMSLLVGGSRSASVTAVMDTELLELTRPDFERTLASVPGFAANLCRSLGEWLRGQIAGDQRHERMHVALVRDCTAAAGLAAQLAATVHAEGGELHVLSDQAPSRDVPNWQTLETSSNFEPELRKRLAACVAQGKRVLVDVARARATATLLAQQELVWWVSAAIAGDQADGPAHASLQDSIHSRVSAVPIQLRGKIHRVEAMVRTSDGKLPPVASKQTSEAFAAEPIRVQYNGADDDAVFTPRAISRLTRHMRGIKVGLALGGGGARGIAHIGVLEEFERNGIYFDDIAGTSAGAIVAAGYAAGIPLETIRNVFEQEMTPPASLAWLPKAPQWYMLSVFRLGLAEGKFRRYLHDYTFGQLLTPAQTVTVDLISGEHRIRSEGDVVDSVLQSINHPVFGAPILRDGEALVDGGVLMNLPVTALRQNRVDYSVAIDVSKQLSREFGGNDRDTPTEQMKRPGYISTLLRVTDIELTNLAALHGAECDFLIAPKTAQYPFDDFTHAKGLVAAGRAAAEAELPRLKESLQRVTSWDRVGSGTGGDRLATARAA